MPKERRRLLKKCSSTNILTSPNISISSEHLFNNIVMKMALSFSFKLDCTVLIQSFLSTSRQTRAYAEGKARIAEEMFEYEHFYLDRLQGQLPASFFQYCNEDSSFFFLQIGLKQWHLKPPLYLTANESICQRKGKDY